MERLPTASSHTPYRIPSLYPATPVDSLWITPFHHAKNRVGSPAGPWGTGLVVLHIVAVLGFAALQALGLARSAPATGGRALVASGL